MYPDLIKQCHLKTLVCDACEFAKHTRTSYPFSNNDSHVSFATVHSDVWGPSSGVSLSSYRWFASFIDYCSWMTWVYLMHAKNEVLFNFQSFHNLIRAQFDAKIQILRNDNGT